VIVLAACGRFDFEAISPTPADAYVIPDCTTMPDGTPCDDHNICTDTSTCQSGVCTNPTVPGSCTVADSQTEFDGTQGHLGWWYGTWHAETVPPPYDPDTSFELSVYADPLWECATPDANEWAWSAWWGNHDDASPLQLPIRRWVSDVSGPAVVTIHIDKSDTSCGDGTEGRLLIDGVTVWSHAVAFDDSVGVTDLIPVQLAIGTKVDAMLHPVGSDSCDSTNFTISIGSP